MKKLKLITYGCQMNEADSERMKLQLKSAGYEETENLNDADLILINTCCVRETAEQKIYGKIGELKRLKNENPNLKIGITGCMAQKEGKNLIKRAGHIDFVLGTGKMSKLVEIVNRLESGESKIVDTSDVSSESSLNLNLRGRASSEFSRYVPIMYGCDNYCTYCIVPYVRGRERSRKPQDIINEVKNLVENGAVEVTLLGQNVNSYGKGGDLKFPDLLRKVDKVEGLKRLRFMTSHPKDLSDKLIEVMSKGQNICEHIHLPVQSGSDRILNKMNRRYTTEHYIRLIEKIRAALPQVSITTDLIVGFPGETEEDFAQTLNFIKNVKFDAAYTFIYSKRSGTPAAQMEGQIEDAIKHERLKRLMEVQNEISLDINNHLQDKAVEVLVEGVSKTDETIFTGRTRTNKLVLFKHGAERAGDLINVRITQPQTWLLKAERI